MTDLQNPYIGLRTYEETDAAMFRGRSAAATELFGMIVDNDVVVLHAESGEGKSSLVNAGLSPLLRDERYFPVRIQFTDSDFAATDPDFDAIVRSRILEAVGSANAAAPAIGLGFDTDTAICVWELLRSHTLSACGAVLTPVLIFDQFEEVFTRAAGMAWTEDFFLWLSRTLSDTVPDDVVAAIRARIGDDAPFPQLQTAKRFKALFSLRTEFMGELDYWAIQRHHIAMMKNSRFCLKPLTDAEADEVLSLQPAFSATDRIRIKAAICQDNGAGRRRQLPVIPAMLLSVVSTTASANIAREGKAFSDLTDLAEGDVSADLFHSVISQFYTNEIKQIGIPRGDLRAIEDALVNTKGRRARIQADCKELKAIRFRDRYRDKLEAHRLIKCSTINGDEYVELSHDALARVIARRRSTSAVAQTSNFKTVALMSMLIMLIYTLFVWKNALLPSDFFSTFGIVPVGKAIRIFTICTIPMFFGAGYLFLRERGAALIGTAAGIIIVLATYSQTRLSGLSMAGLAIIAVSQLAWRWPRRQSPGNVLLYVAKGKVLDDTPMLRGILYIYCLIFLAFLSYRTGLMLNHLQSIPALPFLSGASLWLILHIYNFRGPRSLLIPALGSIFSYMVGMAQHTTDHRMWTPILWALALAGFWYAGRKTVKCKTAMTIVTWLYGVVVLPFIVLGYNILAQNGMSIVGAIRPVSDDALIIKKDSDGLQGVYDRRGRQIIAPHFTRIIKTVTEEDVAVKFALQTPEGKTNWDVFDHLDDRNALTDRAIDLALQTRNYKRIDAAKTLKIVHGLMKRNRKAMAQSVAGKFISDNVSRLINAGNDDDYIYFSPGNNDLATYLSKVNFEDVDISLLPYTARGYQARFLMESLPSMGLGGFSPVGELLADDCDPEAFVAECVSQNLPVAYKSEQVDTESAVRFAIGDLYSRLGSYFLETGDYKAAREFTDKALRHGRFAEPALADNYIARALLGEDVSAELTAHQLDLIRVNKGLEFPDPEMTDAWKFLRYNTLYNLVTERVEYLRKMRAIGPDVELKLFNRIMPPKVAPEGKPATFDYIRLVPDSDSVMTRQFI